MTHPATSTPGPRLGHRAVVLGASLAGLLAARVLAERFDEVVLLERDALPDGAAARKGTPHAVHPHGLLARGREVIEQLFPGFTEALMAQGALGGDLQRDIGFEADGHRFALGDCGHLGLAVSRLAIEAELRRRVLALPGVSAITEVDVVAPVIDEARQRVTGVRIARRDAQAVAGGRDGSVGQTLEADFTIDCTGRGSRTPAWLASWGFEAAPEDKVAVGICYASAYFERRGEHAFRAGIDKAALICTVTNAQPLPGVMIAQEPADDGMPRWVVGLGGYAGNHPGPGIEGMRERALQIGAPELIRLTHEAERIGEVIRYQFPHSQRRRYERLSRFPLGYLALGDALTSFNPIYGQGMTVAACEALALQRELARGLAGLPQRFFRAAARIIDTPWQLAVGGDLGLDAVPGPRPLPVRLVNAWVARLYRVAPHDQVVARAFLKVVHLVAAPATLFAPHIVARVLWRGGRAAAVRSPARPVAHPSLPTRSAA